MIDDIEQMHPGEDGWSDWIHPLPGYLFQCCDCGLIHEMQIAIDPAGDIIPVNEGETKDGIAIFRMRRLDDIDHDLPDDGS